MMTAKAPGALVTALLMLSLPGCGSFEKEAAKQQRYMLETTRSGEQQSTSKHVLEVRTFNVSAAFAANSFVYRNKGGEYSSDFYNEFFVSPGVIMANNSRDWMRRSGMFATVRSGGSRMTATHVLEGDVTELYGDYSKTPAEAVIKIHVVLLDGSDDSLLIDREYSLSEQVTDDLPGSLVGAWNRALGTLLGRLENDLKLSLNKS